MMDNFDFEARVASVLAVAMTGICWVALLAPLVR